MTIRVGINGFGRTGRTFLRNSLELGHKELEIVAINDAYMSAEYMAYIFKYDSVHGRYKGKVEFRENKLFIEGKSIHVQNESKPSNIKWKDAGVDYVVEATGFFTSREDAEGHLKAGAKRVFITAPSKDCPTYVRGVNMDKFNLDEKIISGASETTHCVALLCKLLHEKFRVVEGTITAIHAATSQQRMTDGPPLMSKDWRAGRSINNNIIPATTGADMALGQVLPDLEGKVRGLAFRVPTIDVSVVDLVLRLDKSVSGEEIVRFIKEICEKEEYKDLICYTQEEIVSTDLIGCKHSAVVDLKAGLLVGEKLLKLIAWYDNEWGYSRRLAETLLFVAKQEQRKGIS